PDELVRVVGALRAAEYDGCGVIVQCFRQRVAEPRAPDVERMAAAREHLADTAWRGVLLMQDDQDGTFHRSGIAHRPGHRRFLATELIGCGAIARPRHA